MHSTVAESIVLSKQEVPEELHEKFICSGNAFMKIIVVGSYESVPEVPRVFFEQ